MKHDVMPEEKRKLVCYVYSKEKKQQVFFPVWGYLVRNAEILRSKL